MKRIFALLTIALAALFATAPVNAQNGAVPNGYGLTGAFNVTRTGFTLQLNATYIPQGTSFEITYDLTGAATCGNNFVDVGNNGVDTNPWAPIIVTGNGGPYSQTVTYTFPTPLTGGYVFYANILLNTTQVPFTINPGTMDCNNQNPNPGMTIVKTASPTMIQPYQAVTYSYTVSNTGGTTLTNIVVVDDDGTPNDPSDDHTVTIPSLGPGSSQTFTWVTYPPVTLTVVDQKKGTIPGGTMTVQNFPSGCTPNVNCYLKFNFDQSLGLNDNSYGTTSSAGWGKNGHKFQDLVGSDEADWAFYDKNGTEVLSFSQDYISQAKAPASGCPNTNFTTYGSGYGTLGWCGGDGKFGTGDKTKIISEDTTLTDDLNQSPAFYGYTTNSPAQATPGWNFVDGYSVVLNPAVFGTAGFGSVQIPNVHNSPSINGTDQVCETPSESVSTNTATATATANGMTIKSTPAMASVTILAGKTVCKTK